MNQFSDFKEVDFHGYLEIYRGKESTTMPRLLRVEVWTLYPDGTI